MSGIDPLLLAVSQNQRAYQLVQKLYQQPVSNEFGNTSPQNPRMQNAQLEKKTLEDVMQKRNEAHSQKNEEFSARFRELESRKYDIIRERKSYKTNRLPAIPHSASAVERFSIQAEHGSGNISSLSEETNLLRSSSSQSDAGQIEFISYIRNTLPASVARLNRLRQEFEQAQRIRNIPYRGEFGPQSYKPWQMSDYFLIRPLVEQLVGRILEHVAGVKTPTSNYRSLQMQDRHLSHLSADSKTLQLIAEEIILEETRKQCQNICDEIYELQLFMVNRIESRFLQTFQKASQKDCELTSATHDKLLKILPRHFIDLRKKRLQERQDIWSHSQHLHLFPWRRQKDENSLLPVEDVTVLDFDLLIPFDLIEEKRSVDRTDTAGTWMLKLDAYRQREAEYWSSMVPNSSTLPLTEKSSGISFAKSSFNRRYLALGNIYGKLHVIDFNSEPPQVIRNGGDVDEDAVVDIAWSLDSLKLIAVTEKGVLSIWSLLFDKVLRHEHDGSDSRKGVVEKSPEKLVLLLKLDAAIQDFKFYTGQLAERSSHNPSTKPVLAAFHSSMTLLGTQPSICIAVDSNDVIKCDISDYLYSCVEQDDNGEPETNFASMPIYQPQVLPYSGRMNVIGSDIKAEVFRQHQHPIMLLGFIGNCRDMVTVDRGGYIYIWRYTREFLTKEEIFLPRRKYRLNLTKTQFTPSGDPQMIFLDQENGKQLRGPEVEQQRSAAESLISSAMKNLDLWHYRNYGDQQPAMQVYFHVSSEGVGATGGVFHVISRYTKTNLLASYLTQHYIPIQIEATHFLLCRISPSGREIVFVLLYPQLSPKEAHLTVLVLDLCEMRLRNFRQDVLLVDDGLYQRCQEQDVVSCDITDPIGITASQYVFLLVDGQLSGYSVTTGQKVFMTTAKKNSDFTGCQIQQKKLAISANSMLTINSAPGKLFISFFSPKQKPENRLFILKLTDGSTELTRKLLRNSIVQWNGGRSLPYSEQRMDFSQWTVGPLHGQHHIRAMVKEILESIIDRAVDQKMTTMDGPRELQRRNEIYASLKDEVEFSKKCLEA